MTHTQTRIEAVDAHHEPSFGRWHAVMLAGERAGREDRAHPWLYDEARAQLTARSGNTRHDPMIGYDATGVAVVAGQLSLPLLDNLDTATVQVWTHPDQRRRGHGSAMLRNLEAAAARAGRRVLQGEAAWPVEIPEGTGTPAREFARAHGYGLGLVDVQRELRLPVDPQRLDVLAREAATRHREYELRTFAGPVPDELAVGFAALAASLMTEAPTGEMTREPETASVAVLRENEAVIAAQGRTKFNAIALAPDGQVVAFNELVITASDPGQVYQWGTLVRRDHRGHRLGMAVKVACLRLLQGSEWGLRRVTTWNAEVNSHMVDINERLGFVPVERLGEFERRL